MLYCCDGYTRAKIGVKGKFANDICTPDELDYLIKAYAGDTYRPNVYEYFVRRAISLVKGGGYQAFVVPDRLGFNQQFSKLRVQLVVTVQLAEATGCLSTPLIVFRKSSPRRSPVRSSVSHASQLLSKSDGHQRSSVSPRRFNH